MSDYQPLYVGGRRDSARRYVAPDGSIISRREQIKRTEGHSPEEKAVKRYKEGKSRKGVTVREYERRKGRKIKTKPIDGPIDKSPLPTKRMPTKERRGFCQLSGLYQFWNPAQRRSAKSRGYSTATAKIPRRGTEQHMTLRRQAILNAAASLDGYEWKFTGVVSEQVLLW